MFEILLWFVCSFFSNAPSNMSFSASKSETPTNPSSAGSGPSSNPAAPPEESPLPRLQDPHNKKWKKNDHYHHAEGKKVEDEKVTSTRRRLAR